MERFELESGLKDEIRGRVFGEGFMKIVQTVRREGKTSRVSMRPVMIGGEAMFQAETSEGGRVSVRNLSRQEAETLLEGIIARRGARDMHVIAAKGDLHVRVTRKGRVHATRSAEMDRPAAVLRHDRVKRTPLNSFDSSALLRAIGIADGSGEVRASMRGKYDQVNEFLKAVGETIPAADAEKDAGRAFTVVDCGCGKAYLTFSLYCYLTEVLGYGDVKVIGVDRRADVVASARAVAERLGLSGRVEFAECEIGGFTPERADLVVSLHACDTATDEALAKGVEWGARYVLSAPCCQHELQKAVARAGGDFAGLLRHGILRERLCDMLTDAFRAMIMRILGYRVQVVEFVSPEATSRNIMLKCVYGVKCGQAGAVGEYLGLRDLWKVTPWLETRLQDRLSGLLSRYE